MKNTLEEIKKSLEVITDGNWAFACHDDGRVSLISTQMETLNEMYKQQGQWVYIADFLDTTKSCDVNFIANSKKYVQTLLAEIEVLQKERDKWKREAESWKLDD